MGDVLTLIERAKAAAEVDEQEEMERRLRAGQFTVRRLPPELPDDAAMGPLKSVVGLIPGLGKQLQGVNVDDRSSAAWRRSSSR